MYKLKSQKIIRISAIVVNRGLKFGEINDWYVIILIAVFDRELLWIIFDTYDRSCIAVPAGKSEAAERINVATYLTVSRHDRVILELS